MNSITISFTCYAKWEVHDVNVNNSLCLFGSFASVGSQYYSWSMYCEEVKPTDMSIALGDQERLPWRSDSRMLSWRMNSFWVEKGRQRKNLKGLWGKKELAGWQEELKDQCDEYCEKRGEWD